jgi:hypothetical protein
MKVCLVKYELINGVVKPDLGEMEARITKLNLPDLAVRMSLQILNCVRN